MKTGTPLLFLAQLLPLFLAAPSYADSVAKLKTLAYCQSVGGLKTIQAADQSMADVVSKDKLMAVKAKAFRAKCSAYQSNPAQSGPVLDDFNQSKNDITAAYSDFHASVTKFRADSAAALKNLGTGTVEGDCEGFFKNVDRVVDKMESRYTVQALCGPAAPSLQDLVGH